MIVSFIGHKNFENVPNIKPKLVSALDLLITEYLCDTFAFGSNSKFNDFCWQVVEEMKKTYPHIKTVNYCCGRERCVLAKDKIPGEIYYDSFVRPIRTIGAGKNIYVERNKAMIDDSEYVIFYFNKDYLPENRNSGTKIAYNYAKNKGKHVINLFFKI